MRPLHPKKNPKTRPQDHTIYHERQYPQYSPHVDHPEESISRHWSLAYLVLFLFAFLSVWGLARVHDADALPGMQAFDVRSSALQPSESLTATRLPDAELRPAPVGEPLRPSAEEQELSRALARLDSEMDRTGRLAERVGQVEAYSTLRAKHQELEQAVNDRSIPWTGEECADLDLRTRTLQTELTKFSNELEEVAAVQL